MGFENAIIKKLAGFILIKEMELIGTTSEALKLAQPYLVRASLVTSHD